MCIRDSALASGDFTAAMAYSGSMDNKGIMLVIMVLAQIAAAGISIYILFVKRNEQVEAEEAMKDLSAVSYTHLDVKRARTKKEIYEYAWEDDYLGDDKTINVHISNIRSKLHAVSKQEYIETIWGIGFKWKD